MHSILYKKQNIKEILSLHSLALKKRWGQNFLTNYFFADKIVQLALSLCDLSKMSEPLHIWEIGPGLGSLSALFLAHNVQLTVFEIDYGIINFLEKEFSQEQAAGKLYIVTGAAETMVSQHIAQTQALPHIVCGNLPYSSAVHILVSISALEQLHVPAVYMIQKEAVDRLVSKAGKRNYGVSSVLMQSNFSLTKHFSVSADSFYPVPRVASTVFSCVPHAQSNTNSYAFLCAIVRSAFSQRRKKLSATVVPLLLSMKDLFKNDETQDDRKRKVQSLLEQCSISIHMRAEEVAVESYVYLAQYIHQVIQ